MKYCTISIVRRIGEFMKNIINKKKLFIIMFAVILVVAGLTGSVAYYRTAVEGSLIGSSGNAVFNVTGLTDSGENKTISLGNKLLPGDSGSFNITLDSTGSTVDMYATLKIDRRALPNNLKFYSTTDHKSEISTYYSFLEKSGTNKETLTIYWYWNPFKDDADDNKYIGKDLTADISISAVQMSEYAVMKNGYSNDSSLNGGSEFWNNNYRSYIRTINFSNDLSNLPSSCTLENLCWDISESESQKNKVYGYLIDIGLKDSIDNTKSLYNLYIVSEKVIFAPSDSSSLFSFYRVVDNNYVSNLTQINFNNKFNTSKIIFGGGLFQYCTGLTRLDLSSFNVSNVTNMSWMFHKCSLLTDLNLSSFNTKSAVEISGMFSSCSSLTSLNLSSFNTINIVGMNSLFNECSSLLDLDLSSFDTGNVIDMTYMFLKCSSLKTLEISGFNTEKVTDMKSMFQQCSSLLDLNLNIFNTSKVTDMSYMFYDCSSLKKLDLCNFNTTNVTKMNGMFSNCILLSSLDISSFNTEKVTDMSWMFGICYDLTTTINIMGSSVSSYANMFNGASTNSGAKIIVNYIASASTLVDNMIATKSSNGNVVKGIQL